MGSGGSRRSSLSCHACLHIPPNRPRVGHSKCRGTIHPADGIDYNDHGMQIANMSGVNQNKRASVLNPSSVLKGCHLQIITLKLNLFQRRYSNPPLSSANALPPLSFLPSPSDCVVGKHCIFPFHVTFCTVSALPRVRVQSPFLFPLSEPTSTFRHFFCMSMVTENLSCTKWIV